MKRRGSPLGSGPSDKLRVAKRHFHTRSDACRARYRDHFRGPGLFGHSASVCHPIGGDARWASSDMRTSSLKVPAGA